MTLTAISDPAVRARLWLHPRELGAHGDAALLWLHLADRRVLAFRLPAHCMDDDALIAPIAQAVESDARGTLLDISLPGKISATPLYAALAAPLPNCAWGHRRHAGARAFAAGLDQGILECLARLDTHRFWSSARNYTRLAVGETGVRRRQAVERFPVLAAPILLTAHHGPDFDGGKRHAWRNHSDPVVEAVECGRDLTGALAMFYGISRGLVRAPICARMWGHTGIAHTRLLVLLDSIPAHLRPSSPDQLEHAAPHVAALERLVGEKTLGAVSGKLFRSGWHGLWAKLKTRHVALANALDDARDFLRAAAARAADLDAPTVGEATLGHAWLDRFGLSSLLKASARWHEHLHRKGAAVRPGHAIPAIFASFEDNGSAAHELLSHDALASEGESLHHCVASYWDSVVEDGTRIVSLHLASGQRATAEYAMQARADEVRFRLVQLRGPCNAEVSPAMQRLARSVEDVLNAPRYRDRRAELRRWLGAGVAAITRPAAPGLDPESERQLRGVLVSIRKAGRLDAGEAPDCRISRPEPAGAPWQRLERVNARELR